jgi:hypothetical protein
MPTFYNFANSNSRSMRRLFLFSGSFFSLLLFFSCNNSNSGNSDKLSQNLVNIPASANGNSDGKLPKMVFTDTVFDFGTITTGAKVTHVFKFKNEGQGDLIIASATASCGCTKPSFPHEVKHPGDTGSISVTFDSSNKLGKLEKRITVVSNTQPAYRLLIINVNIIQPSNN